jgi:hypothetical protein
VLEAQGLFSDRQRPLMKWLGLPRWHPIPKRAAGNGQKLGAYADGDINM